MKLFGLFIVSLIIGCALTVGFRFGFLKHQQSENRHLAVISPRVLPTSAFSLEDAPKESLRGTISSMSGTINWQSRTATDSSPLLAPRTIQQGEGLETDKNSKLTLTFPNFATLSVFQYTKLDVIQTLANSTLFQEDTGGIIYTATSGTKFSVRSLHLLTQIDGGQTEITSDDATGTVEVNTTSGTVKVSYNDTDNTTSVTEIHPAQTLIYNDKTRTIDVRNHIY